MLKRLFMMLIFVIFCSHFNYFILSKTSLTPTERYSDDIETYQTRTGNVGASRMGYISFS